MARVVPEFDTLVQRSKRPRSRVGRGLLSANLPVIVQQVADLKVQVAELQAVNERQLVALRKAEAEAKAKAQESAQRSAEKEAAERVARLAEAAKAQAADALEEAEAVEKEAKADVVKAKAKTKKK